MSAFICPPTPAEIENACAELVWFQQTSFARIAEMARPFLDVEDEFEAGLRVHMRRHLAFISDAEIADMATAIMTLAKSGLSNPQNH